MAILGDLRRAHIYAARNVNLARHCMRAHMGDYCYIMHIGNNDGLRDEGRGRGGRGGLDRPH